MTVIAPGAKLGEYWLGAQHFRGALRAPQEEVPSGGEPKRSTRVTLSAPTFGVRFTGNPDPRPAPRSVLDETDSKDVVCGARNGAAVHVLRTPHIEDGGVHPIPGGGCD